MSTFNLDEFPPISAAAWKQKIQFELNGADYQTLLSKTAEGIIIKPFYHSDEFEKISIPSPPKSYITFQLIDVTNEEEANKTALKAVENGITAIKFKIDKPIDLAKLFKDLLGKNIVFNLDLKPISSIFIVSCITFLKNENSLFFIDVIGNLCKTGNWAASHKDDFNVLQQLLKRYSNVHLAIQADVYQNAGATITQQLAYAMAHCNEYLHHFGGEIADRIQLNCAIGSHFFFETSKIRAFRYLFNMLAQ